MRWVPIALCALLLASCNSTNQTNASQKGSSPSANTSPNQSASNTKKSPIPKKSAVTVGIPSKGSSPEAGAFASAKAGDYYFDRTGTQDIKGCVTAEQAPQTPMRLNAGVPSGNRQTVERDGRDSKGQGSVSTAVFEFRRDGVYLAYLSEVDNFPISRSVEFEPKAPVLAIPLRSAPGFSWSFTMISKDGKVTDATDGRVEAVDDKVTTSRGKAATSIRIVTHSRVTGQSADANFEMTVDTTTWYVPDASMLAKDISDSRGSFGLCHVESHIESVIQTLTP